MSFLNFLSPSLSPQRLPISNYYRPLLFLGSSSPALSNTTPLMLSPSNGAHLSPGKRNTEELIGSPSKKRRVIGTFMLLFFCYSHSLPLKCLDHTQLPTPSPTPSQPSLPARHSDLPDTSLPGHRSDESEIDLLILKTLEPSGEQVAPNGLPPPPPPSPIRTNCRSTKPMAKEKRNQERQIVEPDRQRYEEPASVLPSQPFWEDQRTRAVPKLTEGTLCRVCLLVSACQDSSSWEGLIPSCLDGSALEACKDNELWVSNDLLSATMRCRRGDNALRTQMFYNMLWRIQLAAKVERYVALYPCALFIADIYYVSECRRHKVSKAALWRSFLANAMESPMVKEVDRLSQKQWY